jgi:aminoglycoside phosphotransferase (APT) family kinase protein
VVHGDLGLNNILVTEAGEFCLVDWDEARVDVTRFDTLALQKALGQKLTDGEERLLLSWEIAVCWLVEPDYARRLASEFSHERAKNA